MEKLGDSGDDSENNQINDGKVELADRADVLRLATFLDDLLPDYCAVKMHFQSILKDHYSCIVLHLVTQHGAIGVIKSRHPDLLHPTSVHFRRLFSSGRIERGEI